MAQQTLHFGLKINADTGDAKAKLSELKQVLGQLGTGSGFKFNAKQEIREASIAAQQLQQHLAAATSKTGDLDINKFTASIKKGEMSLSEMSTKLLQIGPEGTKAFQTLSTQILNAQKPALSFSNILTKMGTTLANNIRWQLSSAAINAVTGSIREAWDYTKKMDEALTNIRVVTGKSREEMDKLAVSANKMAKELRSTTQEIVKGQLIFYQQGDSAAQAAEKARITTMAANVSFNSSQEEMADYLTAIWNSYQVGSSELELFVDKLAAVGASTATSMEEIATGMQKVAASANAVGVTYDQLNATIATISSTTRVSAEQVGTAMKTIYARMGDLKAGKTDEDGITYGQVSTQMKKLGFDIADTNGQLRDMGEVIEEIGNKWHTLSDETQQALAQAVAGKRQYTNLFALFDNWDMYLDTLETSKNAMGTLQEQQDAWADSIEGASNRVKSSLETLYTQTINDDAVINMTNGLASFLEYFTQLIDALGGLEKILPLIGSMLISAFAPQIINGFSTGIMNLRTIFGGWKSDLEKAREQLTMIKSQNGFANLSTSAQEAVLQTESLVALQEKYIANQKKMSAGEKQRFQAGVDNVTAMYNESQESFKRANTNIIGATKTVTTQPFMEEKIGATNAKNSLKNFSTSNTASQNRAVLDNVGKNLSSEVILNLSPKSQEILNLLKTGGEYKTEIATDVPEEASRKIEEINEALTEYESIVNQVDSREVVLTVDERKELDKLTTDAAEARAALDETTRAINMLDDLPNPDLVNTSQDIQELRNLKQAFDVTDEELAQLEATNPDIIKDGIVKGDIDQLKQVIAKLEELRKKKFEAAQGNIDGFVERTGVDEGTVSDIVTDKTAGFAQKRDANREGNKLLAQDFSKIGQGALQAAGGLATATMALSSFKSGLEAFNNGDILAGLSSILMSVTMFFSGAGQMVQGGKVVIASLKGIAAAHAAQGMSASAAWAATLGPIALIIAGVAAIGVAIYSIVKAYNAAENAAKVMNEEAKNTRQAFDDANQGLKDLKSSFENYSTKQSAIDKMKEGTLEFKQAVLEANTEILDMIDKYPVLAQYVETVNGRLKFKAGAEDAAIKAQTELVNQTYKTNLATQIASKKLNQESIEQKTASEIFETDQALASGILQLVASAGLNPTGWITALDAIELKAHGLDKFTEAVEKNGVSILESQESFKKALGDNKLASSLWEHRDSLKSLGTKIEKNQVALKLNTKQLVVANNKKAAEGNKGVEEIVTDYMLNTEYTKEQYDKIVKDLSKKSWMGYGADSVKGYSWYNPKTWLSNADVWDQGIIEEVFKTIYGDKWEDFVQVKDAGGKSLTLKTKDSSGQWKDWESKDKSVVLEQYVQLKISEDEGLSDQIVQIQNKIKSEIENFSEESSGLIIKEMISKYGGTSEAALEYIKENNLDYLLEYRNTYFEMINSGVNQSKKAALTIEAIWSEIQFNPDFKDFSKALKEGRLEDLEPYLEKFQDLGLLLEEDLSIFQLIKKEWNNFKEGDFSGFTVRFQSDNIVDSINSVKKEFKFDAAREKSGYKDQEGNGVINLYYQHPNSYGYVNQYGTKELFAEGKVYNQMRYEHDPNTGEAVPYFWGESKIDKGTAEGILRSGQIGTFTEDEIATIVAKAYDEITDSYKITPEVLGNKTVEKENSSEVLANYQNTASFKEKMQEFLNLGIKDISRDSLQQLEKMNALPTEEVAAYENAISSLNKAEFDHIELTEDGAKFISKTGEEITTISKNTLAYSAILKDNFVPLKNFSNILGTEVYNGLIKCGQASGWSNGLINAMGENLSKLNNKKLDLSSMIDEINDVATACGTSAMAIFALANLQIHASYDVDWSQPQDWSKGYGGIINDAELHFYVTDKSNPGKKVSMEEISERFKELFGSFNYTDDNNSGITDSSGGGGDDDPQWKKDYEATVKQIEYDAEFLGLTAQQIYDRRYKAFETALNAAKLAGQHQEYINDFMDWSSDLRSSYHDVLEEDEKAWEKEIETGTKSFADIETSFLNTLNKQTLDKNGNLINVYNSLEQKKLKEEFYDDWERYFDSLEQREEKGALKKSQAILEMWNIANDSNFDEAQREAMKERIRTYGEESINSLAEEILKGKTSWEDAIEEFGNIATNTWGIVLDNMTREDFLKLPLEQREALGKSALDIINTIENAWKNNEIDFDTGIARKNNFLNEYGMTLSETDKAKLLNDEKWIEKYISAQSSLYNEGAVSGKQFRNNLLDMAKSFPEYAYKITSAYKEQIKKDIDEIFTMLEDKEIISLNDYLAKVRAELESTGDWGTELGNELWNEALAKGASYTSNKYKAEYDNLIAQQTLSDWGMTENVNNAAEYKMPYAQKWYEQEKANFDYYVANWKGTGSILDDEGYQTQIASLQTAKDNLKGLADEHIQFSLDWINHEESMNRLTYAEKVDAYDRILARIESGYYRQMFANEEDYINWQKEQAASLRQNKIDAAQAEAQQYADILKEKLEDEKTYYENLKSIREKSFDASQTIRESQHELNIELQKSLTMYEYLDEETRKLIFNEEDYVALTDELVRIQGEINDLTSTYESKIASATTEEAELLTAEYEAQIELKLKEFEIAKANLEITKKQLALQNTLNERNTRMFINGQWTWVANQEEVAKAREELAEAEFDAETATLEYEHEQAMNQLDNAINDIERDVNKIDQALEDLEKILNGEEGLNPTLEDLSKAVTKAKNAYNQDDQPDKGKWKTETEKTNVDTLYNYVKSLGKSDEAGGTVLVKNNKRYISYYDENGKLYWDDGSGYGISNKAMLNDIEDMKESAAEKALHKTSKAQQSIGQSSLKDYQEYGEAKNPYGEGIDRSKRYVDKNGNYFYFDSNNNGWVSEQSGAMLGASNKNISAMDGIKIASIETTTESIDKILREENELFKKLAGEGEVLSIGDEFEDLKTKEQSLTNALIDAINNIKINIHNHYSSSSSEEKTDETPANSYNGRIVTKPLLTWTGEDGPEAIIPLSQKYRDKGLSLWEEATKALGIAPSFTMPTIRASFPQQKENMNVSQTINVTVQNEDSSNDFYAITNLL